MGRIVRKKCGFGFSQTPNGLRVPRPNSFRNIIVIEVVGWGLGKQILDGVSCEWCMSWHPQIGMNCSRWGRLIRGDRWSWWGRHLRWKRRRDRRNSPRCVRVRNCPGRRRWTARGRSIAKQIRICRCRSCWSRSRSHLVRSSGFALSWWTCSEQETASGNNVSTLLVTSQKQK